MAPAFASARFPSTAWSCVHAARDPHHPKFVAAMNQLITSYWRPVFHYLRARGHSAANAEDLTQEFFVRYLVRGTPASADASRGRFRDLLRTTVKRFAYDRTVRPRRQERFERQFVSVHTLVQDSDRTWEPPAGETPDEAFEKKWQSDVRAAVLRSLEAFYEGSARDEERQRFAIWSAVHRLRPGEEKPTQEEVAGRFGLTRDQVRYAIADVNRRLDRFLRQELRDQLGLDEDTEVEVRSLR